MEEATNLYDRFKTRLKLRALYAKYLTLFQKGRESAEYIFGMETSDDVLYRAVIGAIERSAQEQVEWLFVQLCIDYGYPVEVASANGRCMIEHDILFEKGDRLIQVDFKSVLNPAVLAVKRPNRAYRGNHRKILSRDEDTYIVYLLKKTPEGDAWIENNSNPESLTKVMLVSDFIAEIFGEDEAARFDSAMCNFSKDMRKELGYNITRIGDERAMEELRAELDTEILRVDYSSIKQANSEMFPQKPDIDETVFQTMQRRFATNYRLLLGESDFAISFLTSEWFSKQKNLLHGADCTYIAAGYFKSIEQMLWAIIQQVSPDGRIGKRQTRIANVDVKSNDTTLGSLYHYFADSESVKLFNSDFGKKADSVRVCLVYYLRQWTSNTRNGYFHKHILNVEDIQKIREQTYLLYFLILGSLTLTQEHRSQLMG